MVCSPERCVGIVVSVCAVFLGGSVCVRCVVSLKREFRQGDGGAKVAQSLTVRRVLAFGAFGACVKRGSSKKAGNVRESRYLRVSRPRRSPMPRAGQGDGSNKSQKAVVNKKKKSKQDDDDDDEVPDIS